MINATELRVGNIIAMPVDSGKPFWKVLEIKELGIIYGQSWEAGTAYCKYEIPSAIPLTPEWLKRLGFVEDRGGWNLPGTQFSLTEKYYPCWMDRMLWPQDIPDFKHLSLTYVHQLQNLFYWLMMGQELAITDPVL